MRGIIALQGYARRSALGWSISFFASPILLPHFTGFTNSSRTFLPLQLHCGASSEPVRRLDHRPSQQSSAHFRSISLSGGYPKDVAAPRGLAKHGAFQYLVQADDERVQIGTMLSI